MKILIFTGAGASVELGVPAMSDMLREFVGHLRQQALPAEVLTLVEQRVESGDYDIENLIEDLDKIVGGREAAADWGISGQDSIAVPIVTLRQEVEWFVLHVCERLTTTQSTALWAPLLQSIGGHEVTIATMNYDRSIEMAASSCGVLVEDGFGPFEDKEFAAWVGLEGERGSEVRLLKLHGSTDWYHEVEADTVWKLRHPMPLFGGLHIARDGEDGPSLKSAAILPSREKKVTQRPFPDLAHHFNAAARTTHVAVFLGTSLRDPDLKSLSGLCANRIPTILVDSGCDSGRAANGAIQVSQTASQFLISTLPELLELPAEKWVPELESTTISAAPVLGDLIRAQDVRRPSAERCQAIENLALAQIQLRQHDLAALVSDGDSSVGVYSVALLVGSPHEAAVRAELAEFIQDGATDDLRAELALLDSVRT